jgi:hypothetical protein
MNQKLLDEALRAAARIAAARGIDIDQAALARAVLAVIGTCNGQNDPEEIEDALELLGPQSISFSARTQTFLSAMASAAVSAGRSDNA